VGRAPDADADMAVESLVLSIETELHEATVITRKVNKDFCMMFI
jgi:hypothetical protein